MVHQVQWCTTTCWYAQKILYIHYALLLSLCLVKFTCAQVSCKIINLITWVKYRELHLIFHIQYNKVLLCYNICRSLLASQFMSYLCLIPVLYAALPDFYSNILFPYFYCAGNVCGQVLVDYIISVANDILCMMRGRGGVCPGTES